MSEFIVIRTIHGRRYLYKERRWRENGERKASSECLGPFDPAPRKRRARSGFIALHAIGFAVGGNAYGDLMDRQHAREPKKEPQKEKAAEPEAKAAEVEGVVSSGAGNGEEASE